MGSSLFARGTAVERQGDGRYLAQLDDVWNCPIVPHGGIVTALISRAMTAELGDAAQELRAVHSVFAGQVKAGPVEIDVQVLRRGRSISQASATLRNPSAPAGLTALAVFGAEREGFDFQDAVPPDGIQPAHECPSFRDPLPEGVPERGIHMNFWDHVEGRPTLGHPPWEDYEPVTSMCAAWYRFDDAPRTDEGVWDPLALVAVCDTMPGAVGQRLGPARGGRNWLPPSTDLTVHVLDDARSEWVLGVNRARHASDGYASADLEVWDMDGADPRLVAYGTQVMFFTFLDS